MELVFGMIFAVISGVIIGWLVRDLMLPKDVEEYFYDKDEDAWM